MLVSLKLFLGLKKLKNVIDNKVVKNTKFNTPKTKVKKISEANPLIHINQYKTDK